MHVGGGLGGFSNVVPGACVTGEALNGAGNSSASRLAGSSGNWNRMIHA